MTNKLNSLDLALDGTCVTISLTKSQMLLIARVLAGAPCVSDEEREECTDLAACFGDANSMNDTDATYNFNL